MEVVLVSRPQRDPGIPGFNSNPYPGILENMIPGFFSYQKNHDFKDFIGF